MEKTKILSFIVIVSIAITLTCMPALATLQYTKTTLYFNVQSLQEVSVYLIGAGSPQGIAAGGAGNTTTDNLNFTCSSQNCLWVNASLASSGSLQTDTTPALTIKNTGNVPVSVNISANDTALNSCESLRYKNASWTATPQSGATALTLTNVTLSSSTNFIAGSQLQVWLYGNFSVCNTGTTTSTLWVWAY